MSEQDERNAIVAFLTKRAEEQEAQSRRCTGADRFAYTLMARETRRLAAEIERGEHLGYTVYHGEAAWAALRRLMTGE